VSVAKPKSVYNLVSNAVLAVSALLEFESSNFAIKAGNSDFNKSNFFN